MRHAAMLAGLVAVVALGGCGRKADPLPPIKEVPETTTDLTVHQEGNDTVLTWSYPQLTRAGSPLVDLERVEVWRLPVPPGQEGVAAGPAGEALRRQLMLARGTLVARLEGESLKQATRGSKLTYSDALPTVPPGTSPGALWYAVRSRRRDGTTSALSNIVSWIPKPVPASVTGLAAKPTRDAIELSWEAVPKGTYAVERRNAAGGAWEIVSPIGIEATQFSDTGAKQGQTWQYRVRTLIQGAASPPEGEITVPYPDVYPPPPVPTLVCLPEPDVVRLRWEASPEAGAHYKVFRRSAGGTWEHLAEDATSTVFTDEHPPAGELEYAVKAVDSAGNESDGVTCAARIGQ